MAEVAYEERAGVTFPPPVPTTAKTGTAVLPYHKAKQFLSGKPLHRPRRRWASEVEANEAREAMRRLSDPNQKPVSFDSIRDELGLD